MAEQNNTPGSPIEFNSMGNILTRLDRITYCINDARQQRNLRNMLDSLIDYFKEIVSDLSKEDTENIWADILVLKNKLNPGLPENASWLLGQLDEMDIRLRISAKKSGFLTRNQKDRGLAVVN